MFYYLTEFKELFFALNIFRYITFRAGMAAVTTFLLCIILGPIFIKKARKYSVGESAKREDCPELDQFNMGKEGTPTMGGIFIIGSIVISTLMWADLSNWYVILTLITCVYLAVLGGVDDYFKLKKIGERGINARTKFFWQVLLAAFIGTNIYFQPQISTQLDVPFFKDVVVHLGPFYILLAMIVLVGSSNAVNLTDGLDGLAIGCVLIVAITLAVLSYITGHINFTDYLFLPHVPGAGELTIICAAIVGASLGFLWFNGYPATVFMGDIGSLALGGTLGVIALFIKKELWLIILGGVFVWEALSVIIQVTSFKLTGKRVFLISPYHHHLQKSGWPESKIIIRFWIIGIILSFITLTMLKVR